MCAFESKPFSMSRRTVKEVVLPIKRGVAVTDANGNISVTFAGAPFNKTPIVVLTPLASADQYFPILRSRAKTGFTAHIRKMVAVPSGGAHTHSFTPAGSISSVSAGTPSGSLSSDSAGTPSGSISSVSAGTPSGSIGSGGLHNHGIPRSDCPAGHANCYTGSPTSDGGSHSDHAFTGSALPTHNHTFTGSGMPVHTHTFTGSALPTHGHTFTGSAGTTDSGGAHTHTEPTSPSGAGVEAMWIAIEPD